MSWYPGWLFRSIAVAAFAIFAGTSLAPAADLPRIASMNVCTDQMLITLADPVQIVGLSRFSRDAWQSFVADDARRFPLLSGGAEDVLVMKPDIVVASLFDKRSTREFLKAKGLHLAEFSVPRNLDDVKAQIREMGDIAGHPDRAKAQIARLDAAVARARQAVTDMHYSVLPLSRRGWVSGRDSLVSSLLAETGLFNAAGELGAGCGRIRFTGSDRQCKTRFSRGVGSRRSRRGRWPRLSAASRAGALLSAGKAHRHSGTADRVRRRDACGCTRPAGCRAEAGWAVTYLRRPCGRRTHNHRRQLYDALLTIHSSTDGGEYRSLLSRTTTS